MSPDVARLPAAAGHHQGGRSSSTSSRYRQRPTFRLAYRNFRDYEALVTNQSVEAHPGRRRERVVRDPAHRGRPTRVFQQGTYAPADGVHRWMGSIAQDRKGNMALGYSVVNAYGRLSRASATRAGCSATRWGR